MHTSKGDTDKSIEGEEGSAVERAEGVDLHSLSVTNVPAMGVWK